MKFDAGSTSHPEYKNGFDPAGEHVVVTNDKSWTWYAPNRDIYSVLVKGGQGEVYVKTVSYDPPAHSGTATSDGLVNGGGNQPAISHITLCGLPAGSQTPTPTPTKTSESPTPTPTQTSESPTPTPTQTSESPTPTPTQTSESPTPTPTQTSESPTPTPTQTSESPTPTPTQTSESPTPVDSGSATPSESGSATPSESGSATPSTSETPVASGSVTPSSTPPVTTPTDPAAGPLPHTGADSASILFAAAAALLVGIALMALGAFRRPRGTHRRLHA